VTLLAASDAVARGDVVILDAPDYRNLAYRPRVTLARSVMTGGAQRE